MIKTRVHKTPMARVFFSAAHKSSGKTTISIGVTAALYQMGHSVQTFKKGPDYIDPLWLGMASNKPCYNLDFNTASSSYIERFFALKAQKKEISIIEGNKGLHDGLSLDGSDSNAAMAQTLDSPVILVLDTRGMTRGIAPLVNGFTQFDKNINVTGVILNQVGGTRHEKKLIEAVKTYTDLEVFGAVYANKDLVVDERHLGLVPGNEHQQAENKINYIASVIKDQVNLDSIIETAHATEPLYVKPLVLKEESNKDLRIGIARDDSFGFYYQDDLDSLSANGAELIFFDTHHDRAIPEVDALFIGGGFPEVHMQQLAANQPMLTSIKSAIDNGMPAYAECGGLMYLSKSISWQGESANMANVLPVNIKMHAKPQGRGYIKLQETGESLWADSKVSDQFIINAHEFHYSAIEENLTSFPFSYNVLRGYGIDGAHDGIIYKNLLAGYAHLRNSEHYQWTTRFLNFIRQCKNQQE